MAAVNVTEFPYKFGAIPSRHDDRTLFTENYISLHPIKEPEILDLTDGIQSWPMYGNDQFGDCTFAGLAHWYGIDSYEQTGTEYIWSNSKLVNDYLSFKHGQDTGAELIDVCNYVRKSGLAGKACLYAFARLRNLDHDSVKTAMYIFTGLYTGFHLPSTAQTQFQNGEVWHVTPEDYVVGGHCVNLVGYNEVGPVCITWGRAQQMTWEYFDKYFFEAWCLIPTDMDKRPLLNHIDLPALIADTKRFAGPLNPSTGFFSYLTDWLRGLWS